MSAILHTGLAVMAVGALSLLGLFALRADQQRVRGFVPALTSLAAGALVGGALFDLIPEAIARHAGPWLVGTGVTSGFVGFWMLEGALRRLARDRPATGLAPPRHPIVTLNFIGDALHNAADGAMIAAAFLTTPTVGVVTTLAIVLHEVPRELGSFGVFVHGGLSVRRAVWYNAVTGLTALGSAGLTLAIGTRMTGLVTTILPVAAGTFLYVAASIVPPMLWGAPSVRDRVQRFALAGATLLVTAVASQLG